MSNELPTGKARVMEALRTGGYSEIDRLSHKRTAEEALGKVAAENADDSDYWDRKGSIINAMLDELSPISDDMPESVAATIDIERQTLVARAGWNKMDPEELEAIWLQGHDTLPYTAEE